MCDVVLVSMPYAGPERPSIALSLLKACLEQEGIGTRVSYGNLWFVQQTGLAEFLLIAGSGTPHLAADWVFAAEAFPEADLDDAEYLRRLEKDPSLRSIRRARSQASAFLDDMVQRVMDHGPRIVGCTSMFHQHVASLALLRRLRRAAPDVVTMMGGAHCEATMGKITHERFDWVDYVVSGEAEELIAVLCRLIFEKGRNAEPGALPAGVVGPCHRNGGASVGPLPRAIVSDLDATPFPDYSDYFEQLHETQLSRDLDPGLMLETARGCWWGQKQPCTFCGLNGEGLRYRAKSPARTIQEVRVLSERYDVDGFMVVDNILNADYFETVLPAWAERTPKYRVFYETKANLRREQVKLLSDAGVRWIQPGIENLHNGVLKLLRKGTTTATNLQLLKWCSEFGVCTAWNLLVDVPGDRDEWYEELTGWLPLICHLPAPTGGMQGIVPVRFDRFSEYAARPEAYGLELSPYWSYRYVYPLSDEDVGALAYYFEDHGPRVRRRPCLERLSLAVVEWQALTRRRTASQLQGKPLEPYVRLDMWAVDGGIRIEDTRPCAVAAEFFLEGLEARVYDTCDVGRSKEALLRELGRDTPGITWTDVEPVLDRLVQEGLMLAMDGRWISLAVRAPQRPVPPASLYPGGFAHLERRKRRVVDRRYGTVFDAYRVQI